MNIGDSSFELDDKTKQKFLDDKKQAYLDKRKQENLEKRKSSDNTESAALRDQGLEYYESGQYDEAFALLTAAALLEDATAQYYLGFMYMNGYGTEKDEDLGIEWITKSSEQGNFQAGIYLYKYENPNWREEELAEIEAKYDEIMESIEGTPEH